MLSNRRTLHRSLGSLLAAGLVGGAIGVAVLGTSQAQAPPPGPPAGAVTAPAPPARPAAEPAAVWTPTISTDASGGVATADPGGARAAAERLRSEVDLDATAARDVAAPTGDGTWTVIPGPDATCVLIDPGRTLCGTAERLARAGVAVAWNRPSPAEQEAGTGTIAFRGLAVDQVTRVAAVTAQGTTVAATTPEGSLFALDVPVADDAVALHVTGTGGRQATVSVR